MNRVTQPKKKRTCIDTDGFKICSKCKERKLATTENFGKRNDGKIGLTSYCRECIRTRSKRRYQENLDENRKYARELARKLRAANPENALEASRRYYKNHPERVLAQTRKYRAEHPEYSRVTENRRRARIKGNIDDLTIQQWQRCLTYFNHKCAACGKDADMWMTLAADHWIPTGQGGGTTATNMVPLCHSKRGGGMTSCNNTKYNLDPMVWLTRRFGERKAKQIEKRIKAYFEWVSSQDK